MNDKIYNSEEEFLKYKNWDKLSPDGQLFLGLLSNAVANSVKGAIERKPLPSTEELVCGQDAKTRALFAQMVETGRKLWNEISLYAKAHHDKANQG